MVDIKISGRKVTVSDALRSHVEEKIGDALKVFDIQPVVSSGDDMYGAIDEAAEKVPRQLRKYKTRIVDKHHHAQNTRGRALSQEELASLIETPAEDLDDQLVREKYIDLLPMTEEEALVQTDLLGHDFYVFVNSTTGLTNVIYHRKNGGYGIIKPRIEEQND